MKRRLHIIIKGLRMILRINFTVTLKVVAQISLMN